MNKRNDALLDSARIDSDSAVTEADLRKWIVGVVEEAWKRPFYREHWGLSDATQVMEMVRNGLFHELPVVRRTHLRDYSERVLDFAEAVDVCSTSGTTGRPLDVPLRHDEEQRRVRYLSKALTELGVRPGDRVLTLISLNDMFTMGPVVWLAIKSLGACAIRLSAQRVDRLLQIIEYIRPVALVGNVNVLARVAEEAKGAWPNPETMPTKRALLGAAGSRDSNCGPTPAAKAVEKFWGVKEHINHYGTTEIGPIGRECLHHTGLHVYNDLNHVELIDPATGAVVTDPNQPGEVVVTALTHPRGFLPVRYATGDIAAWMRTDLCGCGRSSPRIGPVLGRVDQQLKVFGQTVFPDMLLGLVDNCPGVHRSAVRVAIDPLLGEVVTVLVVPTPEAGNVQESIGERLGRNLAVSPKVEILTDEAFRVLEGSFMKRTNLVKVPRFFDFRNNIAPRP